MNRSTIRSTVAALAIVGAVSGTIATAEAGNDPCDQVPAAQDQLRAATDQWQVKSAAYGIANDNMLSNRFRLYDEAKAAGTAYFDAIAAYDSARDACADSK